MLLDELYQKVLMDHYKWPRNRGELADSTLSVSLYNPSCGDRVSLQLRLQRDKIEEIKFVGEGCLISLASASMMTEAVKGRDAEEALSLIELFSKMMQGQDVDTSRFRIEDIEALTGVVKFPTRIKCATLAWKALEKGLTESREQA